MSGIKVDIGIVVEALGVAIADLPATTRHGIINGFQNWLTLSVKGFNGDKFDADIEAVIQEEIIQLAKEAVEDE